MTQHTSQTSSPEVHHINPDDESSLTRLIDGIAAAFHETRLSRAFITEIDNTAPPYPSPALDVARITDGAHSGAELVEAGNFSALAVWETTSYRGLPFTETLRDVGPVREEWRTKVRRSKEQHLGLEIKADGSQDLKPHYHLGFLVRNPGVENVPGSISAVVRPWLTRAEEEGAPTWLEATYSHAVDIYKHFGFRVVEVVTIGKGLRNVEGWPATGDDAIGVDATIMIYDQHLA